MIFNSAGSEFLRLYGAHVDPATPVLPDHVYNVRANTKYAVLENNRVSLFCQLMRGCGSDSSSGGRLGGCSSISSSSERDRSIKVIAVY